MARNKHKNRNRKVVKDVSNDPKKDKYISYLLKQGFSNMQISEIVVGFHHDFSFDIIQYCSNLSFSPDYIRAIVHAFAARLTIEEVERLFHISLDKEQLYCISHSFDYSHMTVEQVAIFAKPCYSSDCMYMISGFIRDGIPKEQLDIICNPSLSFIAMRRIKDLFHDKPFNEAREKAALIILES